MTTGADEDTADRGRWGDGEAADRLVAAGSWTMALRGAELADIRYEGRPVLRAIRFIVRDHDWRTAENVIMGATGDRPDRLTFRARSLVDGEAVLEWDAELELGSTLSFAVSGHALRDFRRNRIGLIVLHGLELAGSPLEILHPDGRVSTADFPTDIAPHQPAMDVSGYRWNNDGVDTELHLLGDVFEMEDQRNWTDASYKTYSTPLAQPFPMPVESGEAFEQSLVLQCRSSSAAEPTLRPVLIRPSAERLPTLQLAASTAPDRFGGAGTGTPIMVEVPADEARWPAVLERARRDAAGGDLDVRIVAAVPDQVTAVVEALRGTAVSRIGVYERISSRTTAPLSAALLRAAATILPGVDLVAGTRAHFTELNRSIEQVTDHGGGLTFSITPQMHDHSRGQVIESLPMQRLVAEQAVRMAAGGPVHIGPVTLRSRFNAVATTPFVPHDDDADDHDSGTLVAGYGAQQVPEATDPRQTSAGVAAWTVCSIAALAVPGVRSVTLFEAWGPRGIRPTPDGPLDPAGRVIDWVRTAGPLQAMPTIKIIDGPTAAIGVLCQQLGNPRAGRQLLIGNPGDRPTVLQVAATTTTAPQSIGAVAVLAAEIGGCRVTLPPASTVRLILSAGE